MPLLFRHVFPTLALLALASCGVKGDPIPYIQVHSEKKDAPPAAKPAPAAPEKKEPGK
jgi:hypothetical protein